MTTRYKLTIEYDGSNYAGWQRQEESGPATIQGEIEKAVHAFCGQSATIQCAGRTDAGVHAWGQVAHTDFEGFSKAMEPFEITKAINAHLRPQPISIIHTETAAPDFHARFSAKNKLYVYRILNRQSFPAIEAGRIWHMRRPLDAAAMHTAAQTLLGQHDFTTFRDSECQAKNPVRTLDKLSVTTLPYDAHGGIEIRIEVEAMSFLHHMVRNIVGTLSLVGEGKWTAADLQTALQAKDRTKGGPTAPAAGLYLKHIDYE
ncbi:MAG: tRNA pseudouridine(38-40) synthase TruA [Alphaproteobacteria bacterium]